MGNMKEFETSHKILECTQPYFHTKLMVFKLNEWKPTPLDLLDCLH